MKTSMFIGNSGLDHKLLHLLEYRVSQINGCAFCLDMHHKDSIHQGDTEQRLHGLPAWRESPWYSDAERAALQFAEALTHCETDDATYEDHLKEYPHILFPYAYNILGSAEDARDVIQDVLTKFYTDAREDIANEKAWLVKSVINHAINTKTRRRRTVQPEVWLPEPVATESADANIYLKDILSYSLLVLLEKLNAKERAIFILKESFDYPHDEIANILSITEEHSRKLLSRARSKLFKPGGTAEVSIRDERAVKITEINHQPAFLFYNRDQLISCQVFDVSPVDGRILQINSVVDPEKLKNIIVRL